MDRDTAGGGKGNRMTYRVLQIPVGQMANFTYIIADEEDSEEAAVIDPSWDLDKVFSALKKNVWKAKYSSIPTATLTMSLATIRWPQ
jgi:hypothetical protein